MRDWARALLCEVAVLWLAARDPRTPLLAKIIAGFVAAYALSPIDLIPDFIPIIGLLDDALLIPAGIWLARRLVPHNLMTDLRLKADQAKPSRSAIGAVFVVSTWLAIAMLGWSWLVG
ncbi:Carbonate dehydratase [Alteripontixanthobacter maritimus]|uniref:Carbonate dehydratase n=1 Tax=Alteripontixanthobacter maritimus TaxID=2161824 RepID=A0A369Q794_9SPHN|nr:YkvA family protein [Alteripontixanthobacter maritimus]RDC60574.1 Carbonate dehydratase [Alteripontixanthobacter maritimus]